MTACIATELPSLVFSPDAALGIDNNVADTWAQSTANKKNSIKQAGSLSVVDLTHVSNAIIAEAARINQKTTASDGSAFRTGQQAVVVDAQNINESVNLSGSIQLPDINQQTKKLAKRFKLAKAELRGGVKAVDTGKSAIGSTTIVMFYDNTVNAKLEKEVSLYADSLKVDANNKTLNVSLAASGGDAGNVGFNGVAISVAMDNSVQAHIDAGATVNVGSGSIIEVDGQGNQIDLGSLVLRAEDDSYMITLGGGVAVSERIGVGASVVVHQLYRDTQAILGASLNDASAGVSGSLNVDGDTLVSAANDGFVGGLSVSAPVTRKTIGIAPDNAADRSVSNPGAFTTNPLSGVTLPTLPGNVSSSVNKPGQTGIGLAGGVVTQRVDDVTRAAINMLANLKTKDLDITATNSTDLASLAGDVARSLNKKTNSSSNSNSSKSRLGLAGALGINTVTGTTAAVIESSSLQDVGNTRIGATREGNIVSIVAGLGQTKGGKSNSKKGITIAGSVSINTVTQTVEATLRNVIDGNVTGGLALSAVDDANIVAIAGAASVGGRVGIGGAVSYNKVNNTVRTLVENATNLSYAGDLSLQATSDGDIISVHGAVGTSKDKQSLAIAATVALNSISNTVESQLKNVSAVPNAGNAQVLAKDNSALFALAGGFAQGETIGAGAGLAFNKIGNVINAAIESSVLTTTGLLTVNAQSAGSVTAIVAGAADAKDLTLAGAVTINEIANRVTAGILLSSVIASEVTMRAEDNSKISSFAGSLAVSRKGAVGASVAINKITNQIRSLITDAKVETAGDIEVLGESNAEIE